MFEIVFLGTSASAPSVHRGLSAQVVIVKNHRYLIDCGEGTQRHMLKSGAGLTDGKRRLHRRGVPGDSSRAGLFRLRVSGETAPPLPGGEGRGVGRPCR